MQVKPKISKNQETYLHVDMFLTSTIHDYLFSKHFLGKLDKLLPHFLNLVLHF